MPTIEASYSDLCRLVGRRLRRDTLDQEMMYAKGEIDLRDRDLLKIDIKDTNRPDLWSAEGIAREIRYRHGTKGMMPYTVKKSGIEVHVDPRTQRVRPAAAAAVISDLRIDARVLSQLIQLQEKISQTFGRKRKEVAIGIYELDRIVPPLKYTATAPDGLRFVPLGFRKAMTPQEILAGHPKGKEYGHLIASSPVYPLWTDAEGTVLSLPPVINSEITGKVTENTRNIFIECTGQSDKFILPALAVLVAACIDRGGQAQSVEICYPHRRVRTPDFTPKQVSVDLAYVNRVSGLGLSPAQARQLFLRSGYAVKSVKGSVWTLLYPAYRQDIMHPIDVVEDLIISRGYNAVPPDRVALPAAGRQLPDELLAYQFGELLIGMGFQEVMNYTLTSKDMLFRKMNRPVQDCVEIENPVSVNWSVFRTGLLPSLLGFLVSNRHVEYPQRIFELGTAVIPDPAAPTRARDVRKLAAVIADSSAGYERMSPVLHAFMRSIGIAFSLKPARHPSLIGGRTASVVAGGTECGMIGEVHPQVLENFGIEIPVVAMELDADVLMGMVR